MKKNIAILSILALLCTANSYAYLDAGTGGMLIQLLLGGIAVVGTFIKIYWQKIKAFTKKLFSKENLKQNSNPQNTESNNEANPE
jgi:hypothetical protein